MKQKSYIIVEIDNIKYAVPYSPTIKQVIYEYELMKSKSLIPVVFNYKDVRSSMTYLEVKHEYEKEILKYIENSEDFDSFISDEYVKVENNNFLDELKKLCFEYDLYMDTFLESAYEGLAIFNYYLTRNNIVRISFDEWDADLGKAREDD